MQAEVILSLKSEAPSEPLAQLLEQLTRALHSLGHAEGLFPAQWAALRYFSRVPAHQATAIQLARMQGMAFGPVSRTVRTLIEKGLLRKAGSAGRGRAALILLTPAGLQMLDHDPLQLLRVVLDRHPAEDRKRLVAVLADVLAAVQSAGQDEPFALGDAEI